jgi:selenium metabolism protein YedF
VARSARCGYAPLVVNTVLLLNHDGMGHGDPTLGLKILGTFLRKTPALDKLRAVLLVNGGVKLAIEGSPVLPELRQLHDNGVDICPCGTCLDHFGLREKLAVGEVSNMDAIVAELAKAEKVITL